MKFSHEIPVSLLKESPSFNDYDYCLLHLCDIPEYKEYYIEASKSGRDVYMDCSAWEYQFIDGGFDEEYYYQTINEIKPTHVIVPDVIGNASETIKKFTEFDFGRIPENSKILGVVQGETYEELHSSFDFMKPRTDIQCIVFHSPAYQSRFHKNSKDEANAIGRVKFIRELIDLKKVDTKSLHLLGLSLPIEIIMYEEELNYILSIDTANPFQFAMTEGSYPSDIEDVRSKPNYILSHDTVRDASLSDENKEIFYKNLERFQRIFE